MATWIRFPDGRQTLQPQPGAAEAALDQFQGLLLEFHGHRPRPRCGCLQAARPLEVVVRRLGNGRCILARLPNEGAAHRPACDFHSASVDHSGRAGYVRGVIAEAADGGFRVRLEQSLTIAEPDPVPLADVARPGRAGAERQRAMTALGLLHALCDEAQLNRWRPGFRGKRTLGLVAGLLAGAADQFRVARMELGDVFVAIAPDRRGGAGRLLQVVRALGQSRRLVLVAAVTSIEPGRFGRHDLRLAGGAAAGLFLSALPGQVETLLRRHPYAERLLAQEQGDRTQHVLGMFIIETEVGDWKGHPIVRARMVRGGLMEVSADFIPIASSLEGQVADRLVAEDRVFTKPLRFDADVDLVLPDFVLTDTVMVSGMPMEVFGRDDATYRHRRAEKVSYYRDAYGMEGWWQWVAAGPDRTDMPAFPEKRGPR